MRGTAAHEQVRAELQGLTGMAPLKAFLTQLEAKVEYVARGGDPRLLEGCLNIVLTGNPGAGKTTAARLLARWLRAHGLLQQDVFVERNALELKGTHIGWTCPQVKEMVAASMGGCLFLDEAYTLSGSRDGDRGDSFADEALRTLLTELENNRTSLCCVLAGYPEAMERLLRADPGLLRRFPHILLLDDYAPGELAAIAASTAHARYGLRLADGVREALAEHIDREHRADIPKRNASLAVGVVEAAMNRLASRLAGGAAVGGAAPYPAHSDAADPRTLLAEDFGILHSRASEEGERAAVLRRIRLLPAELAPARELLLGLCARFSSASPHSGGAEDGSSLLDRAGRLAIVGADVADGAAVARLLHELLRAHGRLTGRLVERSATAILAGDAASWLEDLREAAGGGMLLLHDSDSLLASAQAARHLAAALALLPPKSGVVLLGTSVLELMSLFRTTPALRAACPVTLALPDLTPQQLAERFARSASPPVRDSACPSR